MRKCVSCGQWMGHVICLKGRPEQCADCVTVPLSVFTQSLSQTCSRSGRPPTSQSASQPRQCSSTSQPSKSLTAQSASFSRKHSSSLKRKWSVQSPCAEEKQFSAGFDMCSCHTHGYSTRPSDSSHGDTELMTLVNPECNGDEKLAQLIPQKLCHKPTRGLCVSVPLKLIQDREYSRDIESYLPRCSLQSLHDSRQSGCLTNPPASHPAVRAMAQRNHGMKVLSSVCIPRHSPQQLIYRYKHQKLVQTSREDTASQPQKQSLKSLILCGQEL